MNIKKNYLQCRPVISGVFAVIFLCQAVCPAGVRAADPGLSAGARIGLTASFNPPLLCGLRVAEGDAFHIDFLLDAGDKKEPVAKNEATPLILDFLSALTIPEGDIWVNLSPLEKDRITTEALGTTAMGRDLLSQDYLLKQLTASLLYPDGETGRQFWQKVYAEAHAKFGTADIPVDAFNKVWIAPDKAVVAEDKNGVWIAEARLKVMLESDYLAESKDTRHSPLDTGSANASQELAKQILRDVVIPVLEKEVNSGEHFARLRQIYHSLILAAWLKDKLRQAAEDSIARDYVDRNRTGTIALKDAAQERERIFGQYVELFKKGVFNVIREETDPVTQETVPRKYFSGGISSAELAMRVRAQRIPGIPADRLRERPLLVIATDFAMVTAPAESSARELHSYVRVAEDEAAALHTSVVERFSTQGKRYIRSMIGALRRTRSFVRMRFENVDTEWNQVSVDSLERVSHSGFVKEGDTYWIMKKKKLEGGEWKNIGRRERLAFLLMQGIANLTEIRLLSPEEAGMLGIPSEEAGDYYLSRVVTPDNMVGTLPHQERSQAFSALFAAHIFLRKWDQHLKNFAFQDSGVPVSIDQDEANNQNEYPLTVGFHVFASDFIINAVIDLVKPFISLDDALMYFIDDLQMISDERERAKELPEYDLNVLSHILKDLGLGPAYVEHEGLNKEDIAKTIRAIKAIKDVRALAVEAGYDAEDPIVAYIEAHQKTLGQDVDYMWKLLTKQEGGFRDLDAAMAEAGPQAEPDFSDYKDKKYFLLLDDRPRVLDMYERNLSRLYSDESVRRDRVRRASTVKEADEKMKALRASGVADRDIVVVADYLLREGTSLAFLNMLRHPDDPKDRFDGEILIASGSIVTKSQLPDLEGHGLKYLEKNGRGTFRQLFQQKIKGMLDERWDAGKLVSYRIRELLPEERPMEEKIAYFASGINDLETVFGDAVTSLEDSLRVSGKLTADVEDILTQVRELAELGNVDRSLPFERRVHDFKGNLWEIDDLLTELVQKHGVSGPEMDRTGEILKAFSVYARFLHQLFYYMRGIDKFQALEPILDEAVARFEGRVPTGERSGIALALDKIRTVQSTLQRGEVEDALWGWGQLMNTYRSVQAGLDKILLEHPERKKVLFLGTFRNVFQDFLNGYVAEFGYFHMQGDQPGRVVGKVAVIKSDPAKPDKERAQEIMEKFSQLSGDEIVVIDEEYSDVILAAGKATGFIFGREGAGHILTRARALSMWEGDKEVPLPIAILPDALEFLAPLEGQFIVFESVDGVGRLRLASAEEVASRKVLKRSAVKVTPKIPSFTGSWSMNIREFKKTDEDLLVRALGYKAARQYIRKQNGVGQTTSADTLTMGFIHDLLKANPEKNDEIQAELHAMDKSDMADIRQRLEKIRAIVRGLVMPDNLGWQVRNIMSENRRISSLIFRLSTLVDDMEEHPGVGAGVYGSKENISPYDYQYDPQKLFDLVLEVYASFFSFEAFADREMYGIEHNLELAALMIQEYYADAEYAVLIHTAAPETQDADVMKIEVAPGAGRSLTSPKAEFQGSALVLYYDKRKRALIGRDDPRTQYHPRLFDKQYYQDPQDGVVKPFDKADERFKALFDEKEWPKIVQAVAPEAWGNEKLFRRAQDMEGVIKWGAGWSPDYRCVQTRPQAGFTASLFPAGDAERQEFVDFVNGRIHAMGREHFLNNDFYYDIKRAKEFRGGVNFIKEFLGDRRNPFEKLPKLIEVLYSDPQFADVRESLLRQVFFYSYYSHSEFMGFFNELLYPKKDVTLFDRMAALVRIPWDQIPAERHQDVLWAQSETGHRALEEFVDGKIVTALRTMVLESQDGKKSGEGDDAMLPGSGLRGGIDLNASLEYLRPRSGNGPWPVFSFKKLPSAGGNLQGLIPVVRSVLPLTDPVAFFQNK